jgi:hypothetical protein
VGAAASQIAAARSASRGAGCSTAVYCFRVLDQDIQQGMRAQSRGGVDGSHALQTVRAARPVIGTRCCQGSLTDPFPWAPPHAQAQAGMQELMARIRNIGEKAQASEQTVKVGALPYGRLHPLPQRLLRSL